jgi:hypothetical protein
MKLTVPKVLFYIMGVIVVAFTASLTISFASRIMPDSPMMPYMVFAVLDGGALVWMMVYVALAHGKSQSTMSLIMFAVDLLGVGLMVVSELMLGGQTFAEIPENLGTIAVWGISIVTFLNVVGTYIFHMSDPDLLQKQTIREAEDSIIEGATEYVKAEMENRKSRLSQEMGERMVRSSIISLRLDAPEIIDAKSKPVPEKDLSDKQPILKRIFGGGGDVPEKTYAADTPANPTAPAKKPGAK